MKEFVNYRKTEEPLLKMYFFSSPCRAKINEQVFYKLKRYSFQEACYLNDVVTKLVTIDFYYSHDTAALRYVYEKVSLNSRCQIDVPTFRIDLKGMPCSNLMYFVNLEDVDKNEFEEIISRAIK